jgi:hypothetical protein
MKISRKKFVIIFVLSAFVFQFITNSLLGPKVGGLPVNGDWFSGTGSPMVWKRTVAAIIHPIRIVLVGPLSPIFNDPDPVPPLLAFFCALYWTFLALVLHFILSKINFRKKQEA